MLIALIFTVSMTVCPSLPVASPVPSLSAPMLRVWAAVGAAAASNAANARVRVTIETVGPWLLAGFCVISRP